MTLLDKVRSCYDSITPILQSIAESGISSAKITQIDECQAQITEILDEIPTILSNHEEPALNEMLKYVAEIEQARKIAEMCISIMNEFKSSPSFQKVQSLMFAWTNINDITTIPSE